MGIDSTKTWDEIEDTWGSAAAIYSKSVPVSIVDSSFYEADKGETFGAAPVTVVLSRTGLTLFGRDQEGNPKTDPTIIKSVQGIWPEIEAPPGTIVNVYVGFQDLPNTAVTWQGPRPFTVGTDYFLDFIVTGRYIAVRFESSGQPVWTLTAYDLEIELVGNR